MIVLSLCAIVITVDLLNSLWISDWIFFSVMMSMLAVASSSTITLFVRRIALQMQISCFSPELRFPPFSTILKVRPLPGGSTFASATGLLRRRPPPFFYFFMSSNEFSRSSRSYRPACFSSAVKRSSVSFSKGSKLNFSVPEKREGSCGMTVTTFRTCCKSTFEMS